MSTEPRTLHMNLAFEFPPPRDDLPLRDLEDYVNTAVHAFVQQHRFVVDSLTRGRDGKILRLDLSTKPNEERPSK